MLDGEEIVVKRAVQGEASAFGLLYDHYQPMIYRFVLVKVSRREEAEDLTHQVFLDAWQNVRRYAPQGFPFSSWLYRIARNAVIDYYRTKKKDIPLHDTDPELFIHPETLTKLVGIRLDTERAFAVLRTLKPEYQDVILMRFVEELSIYEVAEVLGKSEGAVKLIQHRALKSIQHILEA